MWYREKISVYVCQFLSVCLSSHPQTEMVDNKAKNHDDEDREDEEDNYNEDYNNLR